jgi:type II secretory pathway component PulF
MLFSKRLPVHSLIGLCRDLRHNLAAGLMLRDVFRQQAKRGTAALRPVAERIRVAIESGENLQTALEQEQGAFPPLFLALAGVGEQSGNLPEVFGALQEYYEMQQRFWRQFISQSVLPVLQFVAATLIIAGLMVILGFIAEVMQQKEPLDPLGIGLTGAPGAVKFLIYIYGAILALIIVYMVLSRAVEQKALFDRLFLRIPALGPFLSALCLARLCLTMRLTLDSSMPVAKAVGLSFRATGNAAFDRDGLKVQEAIRAGEDLTAALTRCRLLPEEFLNIVASAEQGGRVPEALGHQGTFYEEEATRRLAVLTRVAGFAVWVFVAALIIMAIFRIFNLYLNAINQALQMH